MTQAGVEPIKDQIGSPDDSFDMPDWIIEQLKADPQVWKNFEAFPHFYKRLKIGWIKEAGTTERRKLEAQRRLNYLIKMTAQGKRYGTEPLSQR